MRSVLISLALVTLMSIGSVYSTTPTLLTCYIVESCIPDILPNFDPNLCTHLLIIGISVWPNATFTLPNYTHIRQANALKLTNPKLKVMLSLVGSSTIFSDLSSSASKCQRLAKFSSKYLKEMKLDGLDIDWEFPGDNGRKRDKDGFVRLLKTLNEFLKNDEQSLLLSAAVCNNKYIIERAYHIPSINRHVDFINVMNYDFHLFSDDTPFLGYNSPLFPKWFEIFYLKTINFAWSSAEWLRNGMPANKTALGMPLYGRGYSMVFQLCHYVYCPAKGTSKYGVYVPYTTTQQLINNGTLTRVWDKQAKVPYAYRGYQWISYDDAESLSLKTKWVKENGFAGVMVFDLSSDDYRARLGPKKFPLLKTINKELFG